jgi:hypothetical protein
VATLTLAAVGSTKREPSIALAADHFFTLELSGQSSERWLNDTTTQAKDKVKG